MAPSVRIRSSTPRTQRDADVVGEAEAVEVLLPERLLDVCGAAAAASPRDASTWAARLPVSSKRAAEPGLQPELEHDVEQQPLAHPPQHRGRHRRCRSSCQNGANSSRSACSGGEQAIAAVRVVAGLLQDPLDEAVERDRVVADRCAEHRAQREAVGPALHEPGPVGGVLHAVGEDQRLLLRLVEVVAAEDRGERDRQQRGDRRAEEPDAVLLQAGRAGVVARAVAGLGPGVGEHRQHAPLGERRPRRAGERPSTALLGVQPHQPRLVGVRADGSAVGLGLGRGVDERAELAVLGEPGAPDVVGVGPVRSKPPTGARSTAQPDRPQCRQ